MTTKTTYRFGFGKADGDSADKALLGGKGANLAGMAKLGLPIPPGVTITTDVCTAYRATGPTQQQDMCDDLATRVLIDFAEFINPELGYLPLMSVRSGARVSMPGMMDTILNVGMTVETLPIWCDRIGERAACDSYRRLIQMYGSTVDGIPHELFEHALGEAREEAGVETDAELDADALRALIDRFDAIYVECVGEAFPQTVEEQLAGCIGAVFGSWDNERAIEYRIANGIPHEWGTAVTVQTMVFGNMNDKSATGVLFTRNPNTGEPGLFGEYLINAQGEDVVAGIRTPEALGGMEQWNTAVYDELIGFAEAMEAHYNDMQDMEFTVQDGKLFILQTRNGKRSARAAFRIAHDFADAGTIGWADAVKRVTGKQYMALKRPTIAAGFKVKPTFTGLPAAGAVVTGVAVLTAEDAKQSKVPCVLVTEETTPDDFGGMMASVGILTRTGGATSHAAVVARGMDKCCVVGASDMQIGKSIKAGDTVTLDGATGRVWVNVEVPVQAGGLTDEAQQLVHHAKLMGGETKAARITLPVHEWQELVPKSGAVVLNVASFLREDGGARATRLLLELLGSRPKLNGVLEFNEVSEKRAEDYALLAILGQPAQVEPGVSEVTTHKVIKKLTASSHPKALLSRWVVKGAKHVVAAAAERGWGTAFPVATLGELLEIDGACEIAPALDATLESEGVNLATMLALLKKAGKNVQPLPKPLDEDTLVFALLGK